MDENGHMLDYKFSLITLPVNNERRGTGTTLAMPSRRAATAASNSWRRKLRASLTYSLRFSTVTRAYLADS